jgi:hypothetical protein
MDRPDGMCVRDDLQRAERLLLPVLSLVGSELRYASLAGGNGQ